MVENGYCIIKKLTEGLISALFAGFSAHWIYVSLTLHSTAEK